MMLITLTVPFGPTVMYDRGNVLDTAGIDDVIGTLTVGELEHAFFESGVVL